jgi:hypothetical protein
MSTTTVNTTDTNSQHPESHPIVLPDFSWQVVELMGKTVARESAGSSSELLAVWREDHGGSLGRKAFPFHADVRRLCD